MWVLIVLWAGGSATMTVLNIQMAQAQLAYIQQTHFVTQARLIGRGEEIDLMKSNIVTR